MAYVDQIEVDGVVNELQDSTARQQIEELSEVAHSGDYNDLLNKPDLSGFITRSVNDLVNYYTKTETYTKTEVNNLVNAIKQFTYEVVATLPTASASTMYKIYLVPATTTETQNIKDEYITIQSGSTYSWEQIGSTAVDLSGYSTTEQMNAAIANALTNYYTKTSIDEIVATLVSITDFNAFKQEAKSTYARKDGFYETLGAGSAKTLLGNTTTDKEFTSMVMDGNDGLAKINEVKGKSLVWNQLVQNGNFANTTIWRPYNATWSVADGVASITLSGENSRLGNRITLYTGHKYYISFDWTRDNITYVYFAIGATGTAILSINLVPRNTGTLSGRVRHIFGFEFDTNPYAEIYVKQVGNDTPSTATLSNVILFDLTLMFGAGNEPSTIEEFEAMFQLPYYEYNEGEIISNATGTLDVTGFNQWDEEWEYAKGYYDNVDGKLAWKSYYANVFGSKNLIPVLPNTAYFFQTSAFPDIRPYATGYFSVRFADADLNYLTSIQALRGTVTTPANARWAAFTTGNSYGSTYNHDICINLSDPNKNGTYEPYKHADIPLNLNVITGKLNGEGESVTIFPDGMRSAGSVFDSLVADEDGFARKAIVRMGSVDLGTLNWMKNVDTATTFGSSIADAQMPSGNDVVASILCEKYIADQYGRVYSGNADKTIGLSKANHLIKVYDSAYSSGDAATFKTAMNGVMLYYELAEYKEYTLDTPIPLTFQAYHNGVIRQVPQAPDAAPMSMNATFALDAVGTITGLPQNYISAASMDAFLAQLGTAMNGTWTKTYNASTQKYEFTFTPNA